MPSIVRRTRDVDLQLHLLNPQQREAVKHVDGPLLILAGAGSGKTRVITHRVGYLIQQGIAPENILAVSFTNKAATEMGERVAGLIGKTLAEKSHLSTFHSLGADILRRHIKRLGYRSSFNIIDQGDQTAIVKDIIKELKLDPKIVDPRAVLFIISRAKMAFCTPSQLKGFKLNPMMPFAQRVFTHYESQLKGLNAVDFDDLICLPVKLFDEHEDVRQKYGKLFQYVMVDEYQDTNKTQLKFLELIVRDHHNICVVGDDDQSIYAFRGAVSGNILEIDKTFPNTKVIKLEQNYRSTNTILDAANALISNNRYRKEKTLWSDKGKGERIEIIHCEDEREEAEFVAAEVENLRFKHRYAYKDFAVLYRVNPQSRLFEEAFRTYNVPYRLIGGTEFFDRKEVKDFVAYLKTALNPSDELSIRRIVNVPSRSIGATTMERISNYAAEQEIGFYEALEDIVNDIAEIQGLRHNSREHLADFVALIRRFHERFSAPDARVHETARAMLEESHLISHIRSTERSPKVANRRIENLQEVLTSISEFEKRSGGTLEGYLTRITLDQSTENDQPEIDGVQCMTLHASKGLEFPVVFMVGMEDGYLPHARAQKEPGGEEEERRLAYVGITRAKERLVMTLAEIRSRFGKEIECLPSPFLAQLPKDLLDSNTADASSTLVDKREEQNRKYLDALHSAIFKE